jgi:hypothetical protein
MLPLFYQLTFNIGGVDAGPVQAGGSRITTCVSVGAIAVIVLASLFAQL